MYSKGVILDYKHISNKVATECICVCVVGLQGGHRLVFATLAAHPSAVTLACSSEFCSSLCQTREKEQRWGAQGLKPSVFKVSAHLSFCIIHITPWRWSISRLQQELSNKLTRYCHSRHANTYTHYPSLVLPNEREGTVPVDQNHM